MTEKFENLVRWVEENGGYIDKDIYLHVYENGDRCLKTKKYKASATRYNTQKGSTDIKYINGNSK